MKTFKPATGAHWEVTLPDAANELTVELFENRSRLDFYFTGADPTTGGPVSGADSFSKGDPVTIILPKGKWQFSGSNDAGKTWQPQVQLPGGIEIPVTLDGSPFPLLWGRWTRI